MNETERPPRRIAVILGPGSASRFLLDRLRPLLDANPDTELQGIFLEEADVQHAAELPFVKELCRVTFAVREFNSDHFERALTLRMRSARHALDVLAGHTGVRHSFRNVRASAVGLIQEVTAGADITAFEPARPRMMTTLETVRDGRATTRVTVLLANQESLRDSLHAALQLAGGDARRISVLIRAEADGMAGELSASMRDFLPAGPAQVQVMTHDDLALLAAALREQMASVFVVPATPAFTGRPVLQFLRAQVRCPVCLVRRWGS